MRNRPESELPMPELVKKDPKAKEMIRAWIAGSGLHCSLNVGMWHGVHTTDEPSAWGILLADVARHVSNALEEEFGIDRRERETMVSLILGKLSRITLGQPNKSRHKVIVPCDSKEKPRLNHANHLEPPRPCR